MEIKFAGWQSFRIKGKKSVVLVQPFTSNERKGGFPGTTADVVLSKAQLPSTIRTRIQPKYADKPIFFSGPGEYEAAGVEVIGYPCGFWFSRDNVGILWLTNDHPVSKKLLPTAETDVLLMGLAKSGGDWRKQTKETMEMFSPSFLVPFPAFSLSEKELLSGDWAKEFLDLVDQEKLPPVDGLRISPSEDISEDKKIVFLNPCLK